jgi:manganese/iron transport system substrate-binding protein
VKDTARWLFFALATLPVLLFAASGCQPTTTVTLEHAEGDHHADEMPSLSAVTLGEGEKLQVVATTSIVADVVQNVGGDLIDLTTLLPLGTDPHAFEPTPQDVAAVADAHVVFVNGAGLEVFLEPLLESAGEDVTVVPVSYGIALLQLKDAHEHEEKEEDEHDYRDGANPHTWFDPHNVIVWTHNVAHALSALDPDNAATYEANGSAYEAELQELDAWIREQLAQVPEKNRKLVTDHATFSYFARKYGFQQLGAVFPGYSTLAEPSAQDLAELEDGIREFDVRAVFVGLTISPDLAERVADDTGIQLVFLYTGSLSEPGGPADDYLSFMRYNVSAIAEALR